MANGDRKYQWAPFPGGSTGRLYKMLDAQVATDSGQWILLGAWNDCVFYVEDADANNTISVEVGVSEDKGTEPTVAYEVATANSKTNFRLNDGDQAMWVRVKKTATDSTATTVYMWVTYFGGSY